MSLFRSLALVGACCLLLAFAGCNDELPFFEVDAGGDTGGGDSGGGDTGGDGGGEPCVDGDTRPAGDGCNTCSCSDGEWLCSLMGCPEVECITDDDCVVSGCSGELCASEDMASDCEWLPEYACYADPITSCGCNDGRCGWDETDELAACLETPPCSPGEIRDADDGCNTCTCTDDGGWVCSEMPCRPSECEPGDIGGDCGECSCDDAGRWICADVDCECSTGDTMIDECGTFCECSADWVWVCTPGELCGCEPGERRHAECESCVCTDSGEWHCEEVPGCHERCEPGEERVDACEHCICGDDGDWSCATIPDCELCTPGTRWEAGCDVCHCTDSGEVVCETDPECSRECTPGETRPAGDDCNTCTCTDDGAWACTELACPEECASDDDCIVSGCSGQVCASTEVFTTCEWLPHYACFHDEEITTCTCSAGRCEWAATAALADCRASPPGDG